MDKQCQWKDKIFNVSEKDFEQLALDQFYFQYENNKVYRDYVNAIKVDVQAIDSLTRIPFLPIRFFKSHQVVSTWFSPEEIFESSGTTGSINSKHFVKEIELYRESFVKGFELFYGPATDWCIIGLLPSYLERQNSSLVYMVNELIKMSGNDNSGFYLDEFENLFNLLQKLAGQNQKTLLIGVTFGLLDFSEAFSSSFYPGLFKELTIMETGGMKGRRSEMIRQEVHDVLKKSFKVPVIHSEYGMTELLSQAYSTGEGIFKCPPWMKVFTRDELDPLSIYKPGDNHNSSSVKGILNIIDLANIYSCSFIATDDAGKVFPEGRFEVLGRTDNSDMRGCSLMLI